MELSNTTTATTTTMWTDDEEEAAAAVTTIDRASESSRLVLVPDSDGNVTATKNRTTTTWKRRGVAAASLLLLIVGGTFHSSHLRRGTIAGSSEMNVVHYVPEAGTKGGSCLFFWGTACGSELSGDDNHVCQDNAKEGDLCGDYANSIDCASDLWCLTYYPNVDNSDVTHCR